jgi:L-malate glycosyltransferase
MKKILIIDNSVALTGAFKCALQEAELLRNDFNFIFILPRSSGLVSFVTEKGFTCYTLPLREINRSVINNVLYFPSLFKNVAALKKICKKEKIDVIQVNDFYNLLGSFAKLFGAAQKLITYVRLLPSARPSVLSKWWSRMAVRFSYRVVCVSKAVLREMPARDNVIHIYDPVSFEENGEVAKEPHREVILLYLANYIEGKGQQYALDAFAIAYKKNSLIRLRFAGGDMGLEKNRLYKSQLVDKAGNLAIGQVVEFSGFVRDTEKIIKEADVVLNFSDAESFSMTCAEASFYGRPVIATRCGGPEEIILDNVSGILVDKNSLSEMAEAILVLSNDAERRKQFGEYGRDFVKKKFNKQNFIGSFKEMV